MSEVIYNDALAKRLFDIISETRSPTVEIDWDHLSDGERTFYRQAAHKLQAENVMNVEVLDDSADLDDDQPEDVINLARALTVGQVSVGILRDETGEPCLVGHFGGFQRDDPEKSVGVAFMMSVEGIAGFFRQVIGASMAVDPSMAAEIATAATGAIKEGTSRLTIPVVRPRHIREN